MSNSSLSTESQPRPQYYKLTLERAKQHYLFGDITAKGLLHLYILLKCRPGWKIKLTHQKVYQELGIRKATFYKAISRLKEDKCIDWEAPEGIVVSVQSTIVDSESTIVDSESTIVDSESTIVDSESTIVDLKPPKPVPCGAFSDPLDYYQIFIRSLSHSEREKFEKFVREEWKNQTGKDIISLPRFLASGSDFVNWRDKFFSSPAGRAAKQEVSQRDWQNHPCLIQWLHAAYEGGYEWTQHEESEKEERLAFYRWAQQTNAYVGVVEDAS